MAEIGSIIDQKYEILTQIGKGGMSVVYLGMDRRLNKQWAIKEIKKSSGKLKEDVIVQSLLTEANLMKRLDHALLPRIVDIIEDEKNIYVVMDYIEGKSLDIILEETGAQSQENVIEWAKQLCDVLGYLHSRKPAIIYRDMKPANIMLKPEGGLKLIDLGIAREEKVNQVKDTVNLGTRGYASPEQLGVGGKTDIRSDIYCLGVTLYHLVTGKSPVEPPYELYPIRHWNSALSGGLEAIIIKCTQTDPANRYQNCEELMYDLEHYNEIDEDYKRGQKKKLSVFAMSVFMTVALCISGFVFEYMSRQNNKENYDLAVQAALKSTEQKEQIENYKKAIEYDATRTDAYKGMIETYKISGGKFDIEEEQEFISLVKENMLEIKKKSPKGYVDLCYEIGKLYWFYYDYGNTEDNQLTRSKNAISWFKDVVDVTEEQNLDSTNANVARIYYNIGLFNRDYSMYIHEAKINEECKEYFAQLLMLLGYLEENIDEDELTLWEGYKVMAFSLETYMSKFKSSGIEKEEIVSFVDRIWENIQNLEATDELTQNIQAQLCEKLQEDTGVILQKIELAYE